MSPNRFEKVTRGNMKIKGKVLSLLEGRQGECISGEEIAKKLGVTRNCIWRSINSLKEEGHKIISQSNTGYLLSSEEDVFSASRIEHLSSNNISVVLIDDADSSNNVASELAKQGAPEGTVVVVKRQNAGKGRMGRSFISNEENGLYMSIILRPKIQASESVNITVACAVAVLEAIEELSGKKCSIKWVNDIYIGNKKVCGILTEGALNVESGCFDFAIVGIGINITPPENGFADEIKDIATSVYDGKAPNGFKSALCALATDKFLHYYRSIENKSYIASYREHSNLIGESVCVYRGNDVVNGVVLDIDDNARLILKTEQGEVAFSSGEARARKNEQ